MEVNGCLSEKKQNFGGGEKIPPPIALDLPPTSSPKLKAMTKQRVHELGCPSNVYIREQI